MDLNFHVLRHGFVEIHLRLSNVRSSAKKSFAVNTLRLRLAICANTIPIKTPSSIPNMSNGASDRSSDRTSRRSSGGSSRRSSGGSSIESRSTTTDYCPIIVEIRGIAESEAVDGKTVYIKYNDHSEQRINSVWDCRAYNVDLGDHMLRREYPRDFWKAYNTIAQFILHGKIKLSGGKDCFKRLASPPQPGCRTLAAGNGIFFKPNEDMETYGTIYQSAQNDTLTKAHISLPDYDAHGNPTNSIRLLKGERYLIAGDNSNTIACNRIPPKLLICHRERLLEAGYEIPGAIAGDDLWLFDRAGKWHGIQPLHAPLEICSGCRQSYANREWPTPDVCEGDGHCDNAFSLVGSRAKSLGYTPALAEVECASCIVSTYNGGRYYFCRPHRYIEDVKRVLDASFTIRDWDHLSEATGYSHYVLAVLFCSVPTLGKRLNKKGASFVPWASDYGLILGDYLRLRAVDLRDLYVVKGETVIEAHTGLAIKFKKDGNGVTHVERGSEDCSDRLPEGVDGLVCLG